MKSIYVLSKLTNLKKMQDKKVGERKTGEKGDIVQIGEREKERIRANAKE